MDVVALSPTVIGGKKTTKKYMKKQKMSRNKKSKKKSIKDIKKLKNKNQSFQQ